MGLSSILITLKIEKFTINQRPLDLQSMRQLLNSKSTLNITIPYLWPWASLVVDGSVFRSSKNCPTSLSSWHYIKDANTDEYKWYRRKEITLDSQQ